MKRNSRGLPSNQKDFAAIPGSDHWYTHQGMDLPKKRMQKKLKLMMLHDRIKAKNDG